MGRQEEEEEGRGEEGWEREVPWWGCKGCPLSRGHQRKQTSPLVVCWGGWPQGGGQMG